MFSNELKHLKVFFKKLKYLLNFVHIIELLDLFQKIQEVKQKAQAVETNFQITVLEYFEYVQIQKHAKLHKLIPLQVDTFQVLGQEDEKHHLVIEESLFIKSDNFSLNRNVGSVQLFRIAKEFFKLYIDEKCKNKRGNTKPYF